MSERKVVKMATIDGNEAASDVAYRLSEVCAIYPITPSSNMGENADEWAAAGRKNVWGDVPQVVEMQSEGGAAGAVHGALQTGALATTFTASQGLLLMIPNMFKIAGELTPCIFHVSARTVAAHALSIFGDHSDVMACRSTGWGMLVSNSVQEAHDMALIAHAATLEARLPFIHFFDGFRTSHEVQKIEKIGDEALRAMVPDALVAAHRARALSPDRPMIRGTAQNPDVFFQSRETVNPFYAKAPAAVLSAMERFEKVVGRRYRLFDYVGAPDAERVVVMMGSGAEAAHECVDALVAKGEKVGLLKVRLYRPLDGAALLAALPKSARSIAVLDRTKEPGAAGEPLYQDVVTVFSEALSAGSIAAMPRVLGGRYGLSSKEFTPAMVKAVLDNLAAKALKNHFTVGIIDDVSRTSLEVDASFSTEAADVFRGVFFGLGSDGTVGANKNSIKIIGEETENYAQGYFVYDSKKSGSLTVSHLRFGPRPIRSTYLIREAKFVACHNPVFLDRYDVLGLALPGAIFLLNTSVPKEQVWDSLPREAQEHVVKKGLKMYVIDATQVAEATGMGGRVNTIMQTCFFAISGVLPREEAIAQIKKAIEKTYGKKGEAVVKQNFAAVDATLANLHEVKTPGKATATRGIPPAVSAQAPEFLRKVTAEIISGRGDLLPVSAFPVDGTFPSASARWEKRNIAIRTPVWDPAICIQCNKCVFACPHACIRSKIYPKESLTDAPAGFRSIPIKGKDVETPAGEHLFTIQVTPEDCTGCSLCVETCPAKSKTDPKRRAINMEIQPPIRAREAAYWDFFQALPEVDRTKVKMTVRGTGFLTPLFEFSGACAGCGETPYIRLLSSLFGDRAVVANATGCSSIYGGNLPTTPWGTDRNGRGPAWSNSLFEDNAEFGMGFRVSLDAQTAIARSLVETLRKEIGEDLAAGLLSAQQRDEAGIQAQRERVADLKKRLAGVTRPEGARLAALADVLARKSVWIVGGDGWAYDIGYGGLDHVLACGRNVNVLVLDTEVYSNTGGQMSKSTPRGAVAKFAAGGKPMPKKDLGLMAMAYGGVYVAQIAFGADDVQTLKAFLEAESYDGPSMIIAYSHCIAHGIRVEEGVGSKHQKLAVESGAWPLYRFDPRRAAEGKTPLVIDSKPPKIPLEQYIYAETRYKMLTKSNPEDAARLLKLAEEDVKARWRLYQHMAAMRLEDAAAAAKAPVPAG